MYKNKKNIIIIFSILIISILIRIIFNYQKNNTSNKIIQTNANTLASNKIVILDARTWWGRWAVLLVILVM